MADDKGPALDWARFGWEVMTGLAAATAAVFSMFANHQSNQNADVLNKLKLQADLRQQQSELDIKVYDLVEKALSLEWPAAKGHGVAAAAMINALTAPPLRDQLLNALKAGSKDQELVRQLEETLQFDAQPISSASPGGGPDGAVSQAGAGWRSWFDRLEPRLLAQGLPGPLKGFTIDLFYCEGSNPQLTEARRKRAEAAGERLKGNPQDITARVRMLPSLVQARPGYQSYADEVRFDDEPREAAAAKFLGGLLKIQPENLRKVTIRPTPNYLTVFYCGAQ